VPLTKAQVDDTRRRSVDHLQRLFAFVTSAAIGLVLTHVLNPPVPILPEAFRGDVFMTFSLLVILVPFFHGNNRYFDATYITGESGAHIPSLSFAKGQAPFPYALGFDFLVLCLEAGILFAAALLIGKSQAFYALLAFLLVFDAGWVVLTMFYTEPTEHRSNVVVAWALNNLIAAALLLWTTHDVLITSSRLADLVPAVVCLERTILDYLVMWKFYYRKYDPPDASAPAAA
jgi:hypothetical protein